MALEDIEKKLYETEKEMADEREILESKNNATRRQTGIPDKWGKDEFSNKPDLNFDNVAAITERFPVKKIILWGIVLISIIALVVTGYLLYQAFTFSGVSLQINLDEPVLAGVPFDVTINYSNNSPAFLNNTKLSLTLPPEFSFVGGDTTRRVQSEDIGTIGTGTVGQKNMQVTALKGEGTCADIVATIKYGATGAGSSFEKNVTKSVCVGGAAAVLDVFNSNQVYSNETFDIKINYKNISKSPLQNLELRLEYPQNYTFQKASLKPDTGDNTWRLGDLRPGSVNEITVEGSVIAQADSFFEMKIKLVSKSEAGEYVVTEKTVSISVSQPPLSIAILANSSIDHIAKSGESLKYTLQFKNNTDIGFRDVVIKARLTGEMFDFTSIDKNIDFNSVTREITWNKASQEALGLLTPGSSGEVSFGINLNNSYPITKLSDKNFTLKADAQIDSPTVPSFISAERTLSIASLTTKIMGQVTVDAKGLFRDAASGIINKGPMPPRVNMTTNYTIHWIVKNYSTDVSNVEIRAFLKPGVRATGVVKSNIETTPIYNDRTQEIVWNIPKIQATRGVISEPIESIFQIEALPGVNQAGNNMSLIGETSISALDLFTNINLNNTAADINTSLNNNDPTLKTKDFNVAP